MVPFARGCLLVLIIVALCRVTIQAKPIIKPDTDELILNEGDPLEIVCSGSQKIYFMYPFPSVDAVTLSDPEVRETVEGGVYKYEFRRQQTAHGDTGWYGCAEHPVEVIIDSYNDTSIAWLYVYVQSNESFFVQHAEFTPLREMVGGTVVIPCRPTSPNLTVTLLKDSSEEFMDEHSERVTFHPRIGYSIAYVTITDSGYFKCLIKQGTPDEQEVNYHLNVLRKHSLAEPKIIEDTLRHVTRGQSLHVNCTIDVAAETDYALNWKTPQQSNRITTIRYSTIFGRNNRRATSELVIRNVMDEDEGEYECIITTYYDSKSTKKYIEVHDPDIKFINLTSQDRDRHYQARYGSKVQWVVHVYAYPQPILRWLNPKGEDILDNWKDPESTKYAINTTPSQTILRINRLHVDDMGIYSLQAANEDMIATLNFTLDVMARPIPLLTDIQSYYAPNETIPFECHVAAFPTPNITWTFLKCPNYPSFENSMTVDLSNTTEEGKMTSFLSTVLMTIEVSGHLTCTACNSLGCDSVTENVFVSDGDGGFGVLDPKLPVTQGDNIELICAASVYNYTDSVTWKNDDESPILENGRVKVVQTKTKFTYRSILKINGVQKEDAKFYLCLGETVDGMLERLDYELFVHEARAPYFKSTNMNNTEVTIDLNTDSHKLVVLWCFVDGMPKPNITWLKDDKILNGSERHRFFRDRQELRLKYLLEADSGRYTCRVENRIGKAEVYHQIIVKGKEVPKGLIILIAVLVVIVIILVVFFTIKVRREKIMRKELMEAGLMHFEEGALECLNPDLTVDDQAELLPYDKKWEFPRERLKLGKQLGSGAFGVVMKAEAQGICEEEAVTTVAVKMVRRTTDPTYVRALASELKIMVHLGKHLNVVNLLGACTKNIAKRELLVIVEYCRFGNLHNYLLRHRADFINQIDPTTGKFDPTIGLDLLARANSVGSNNRIKYAALSFSRSLSGNSGMDSAHYCQGPSTDSQGVSMSPDGCVLSNNSIQPGWRSNYRGDYKDHNLKPICTQDLLSWAFQVARGMEYLSQRRVLHGDLAARNILLAENNIVKICDFGLAKTMYKDDNYKKKGDGPLPIKWMAIESIRDRVFSTQSDIWSFGIVLWEFFTLAETPYPGMEAKNQYQQLIEGYRMEQPEYATSEVYDIMLKCWKAKPTLRPSFTELVDSIGDLLEESVKAHYISLNDPYMDMNTMYLEGGKNDYLTMMSRPDHTALSSPTHDYVNSPAIGNPPDSAYLCMSPTEGRDESGIFSPRPTQEKTHFEFPSPTSDSEDAIELSPMLKKQDEEEDPYLKPINVHERRAEFARQRQALKSHAFDTAQDRDSGYCNAPRNLPLIDLNGRNGGRAKDQEEEDNGVDTGSNPSKHKECMPPIIRTQDNYVNMPKQKSDMLRDMPDGFSNPSYVMMGNHETDQTKV